MLITRVLANPLALKAAYDDLPPNEAEAATTWKRIVDVIRADFEVRKTDRARACAPCPTAKWLARGFGNALS